MSLIATRVLPWRIATQDFDKNMYRPCEYGALDFFVSQTNSGRSFVTPELRNRAIASMGRTVQIPVINFDETVTIGNQRLCVVQDSENTSALYVLAFATYTGGFTMLPLMHTNNDVSYQQDFNVKMTKWMKALANALDLGAVSALEANKTQVFKDALDYPIAGNIISTDWMNRNEVFGDVEPIMRANCYQDGVHIIGNAGVDSITRKQAQLGPNNAINKVLEFAGKQFHYTNNVVNEDGQYATFFAVDDGQVGVVTRSSREALAGVSFNNHEWSRENIPLLGLPVDVHYYTSVGDYSTTAGESTADMTCTPKEHFGFAVDICYMVAYNSDPSTIANPIIKGQIASGDGVRAAIPVVITNAEGMPVFTQEVPVTP